MQAKRLFSSKEIWFNLAMTAYNVLVATNALPQLLALIPPPWGMVAQGVGTIVLRAFFTNTPIFAAPPTTGPLRPPA